MKYKIIFLSVVFLSIIGCGDTPIFTEMKTSRLKVVIKGTFETDGVSQFVDMADYESDLTNSVFQDDSVDDVPSGTHDVLPATFMLDIAEFRLDGKKISNYRQVHEFSLNDADEAGEDFFNGRGVELKNDDPAEGNYDTVQVYIRKMIFDKAMIYESDGNTLTYDDAASVIFHENERNGFDFNQLQVESYWDSLRLEGGEELRNFPLRIPIIGGLKYNKNNDETVLEIRFVIKNFIKKYEYDFYNSGVFKVCHYYAPSDWLRDVKAGEKYVGRNLLTVARAYVPGKTAESVTVTGLSPDTYVIAIPESEFITDYYKTSAGNRGFGCDLPQPPSYPGSYIEAVLDYYLKYEDYKYSWNDAAGSCVDFTAYQSAWDTYESAVENFKIAPYVASTGATGNSVAFTNMAPGRYKFYSIARPVYGDLFTGSDPYAKHNLEAAVQVDEGANLSFTFIP